jgi:hypothetical protein
LVAASGRAVPKHSPTQFILLDQGVTFQTAFQNCIGTGIICETCARQAGVIAVSRRESTVQTSRNALSSGEIPAFAGMAGASKGIPAQMAPALGISLYRTNLEMPHAAVLPERLHIGATGWRRAGCSDFRF